MTIDCREAVRRMWAYLDHELEPKPAAELETHLDTCLRCCGELEFSRRLRGRLADVEAVQVMPPKLRSRIETLLADGNLRAGDSK